MDHYEKACGAVVLRKQDTHLEVLLIQQNDGHWGFPKGHVEKHETEQETALREVREETGLEVEIFSSFRQETHYQPSPGVHKDVVYFLARPVGGAESMQREELQDMQWLRLADAQSAITYENDVELLRSAIRYYRSHESEGE